VPLINDKSLPPLSQRVGFFGVRLPLRSTTCLALALASCSPDVPASDRAASGAGERIDTVSAQGQQAGGAGGIPAGRFTRLLERTVIGLLEHGPEDWLGQISAIAVDRLGRVYVADTYAHNGECSTRPESM
jgi:hypothetical protein